MRTSNSSLISTLLVLLLAASLIAPSMTMASEHNGADASKNPEKSKHPRGDPEPLLTPDPEKFTLDDALGMYEVANGALNPVYEPLAAQIVSDYDLEQRKGIGIDIGGGPGTLAIELAKKTKNMYWINSDINPHFFKLFFQDARKAGVAHEVEAIFADAKSLPFRDRYADVIVSRGSLHMWGDWPPAFSEIYRVLKPGGVAYVGRGFARDMPVEEAKSVRENQGGGPRYNPPKFAEALRDVLKQLPIEHWKVERPNTDNEEGVNYGVWVEIRKPEAKE